MSWDWEKLKEQQEKRNGPPPQVDELITRLREFKMPIGRGGPSLVIFLLVVALLIYMSFFTVNTDEVGVVQRFGRYTRTAQPGLHLKWPDGIETVTKVKVRQIKAVEFGFRPHRAARGDLQNADVQLPDVALMLTGDLNVAIVPWVVQYRINDPVKYLFKVKEPTSLLKDMAESAMRLVVGDRSINEVISKREEIALEAQELLQKELDDADSGIEVYTIEMQKTNVPEPVQPSFNEVNQATQEKERMIYKAKEEYNKEVPAARGDAERTIKAAEGYAIERVNQAKGDAARFRAIYTEYAKAKEVTRHRLYLETLRTLLPKIGEKYIIDADQRNFLPLLNMGQGKGMANETK